MNSIITMEDTIAAIATAINIGEGGIAVIRISGADSIQICKTVIETKSKLAWKSRLHQPLFESMSLDVPTCQKDILPTRQSYRLSQLSVVVDCSVTPRASNII